MKAGDVGVLCAADKDIWVDHTSEWRQGKRGTKERPWGESCVLVDMWKQVKKGEERGQGGKITAGVIKTYSARDWI